MLNSFRVFLESSCSLIYGFRIAKSGFRISDSGFRFPGFRVALCCMIFEAAKILIQLSYHSLAVVFTEKVKKLSIRS